MVGSGAIGLYYGGRLAAAGEKVKFLARSGYDALAQDGLTAESIHGNFQLDKLQVFRTAQEIGAVDLVLITTKTQANSSLHLLLPPLLHEKTLVMTMQNGLGNCETLTDFVDADRVLGALCFVCINRTQANHIVHSGAGRVAFGPWENACEQALACVQQRFSQAGILCKRVDDLARAQWEKLVWNIPFNGLSIIHGGVTTDFLLENVRWREEVRELMAEVIAGAQAQGIALDERLIEQNLLGTVPMGAYRTSSMIDFLAGRPIELGAIWEEPLRRALLAGAKMPRLQALVDELKHLQAGKNSD